MSSHQSCMHNTHGIISARRNRAPFAIVWHMMQLILMLISVKVFRITLKVFSCVNYVQAPRIPCSLQKTDKAILIHPEWLDQISTNKIRALINTWSASFLTWNLISFLFFPFVHAKLDESAIFAGKKSTHTMQSVPHVCDPLKCSH